MSFEIHDFYCIKCGNRSMSLPRQRGHLHKKFHYKSLYCPHCKVEVNHVEIRDQFEREQFLEDFKEGIYEQDCKNSLSYVGSSRIW